MSATIKSDNANTVRAFIVLLYIIIVSRLWLMPFGNSLWLDETATYWNVMHGFNEALRRSSHCPGNFQLYMGIVALSTKLFGLNEIGLRIPSLIALLFSSLLVYKIAKPFFGTDAALYAVVFFACTPEVATHASNARPYALGIFLSLLSIFAVIEFIQSRLFKYVILFIISSTLLVLTHVIFIYFIPLLLAATLLLRYKYERLSYYEIALLNTPVIVSSLIYLAYMVIVVNHSAELSVIGTPSFFDLVGFILPSQNIFALALVLAVLIISKRNEMLDCSYIRSSLFIFTFAWYLFPFVLMYIVSVETDYKILILRYIAIAFPALAFILSALVTSINQLKLRLIVIILICSIFTIASGGLSVLPSIRTEQWREAINASNKIITALPMPLLFNSGLIETTKPGWETTNTEDYLMAPLSTYPINTDILAMPIYYNRESEFYLNNCIKKNIKSLDRFLLLYRRYFADNIETWVSSTSSQYGFSRHLIGNFNGVVLVFYTKDKDDLHIISSLLAPSG